MPILLSDLDALVDDAKEAIARARALQTAAHRLAVMALQADDHDYGMHPAFWREFRQAADDVLVLAGASRRS